ncbi:hypothetical protein F9F36_02530 [Campylobacter upsaliensis]|nr:hypothetical protein [Campylobacter upsaliensis]
MQENIEKNSKLANFPIVLFASVMGIGGLSLVFKKASVAFNHQAFLAWSCLWLCDFSIDYFCTFICVLWCENTLLF